MTHKPIPKPTWYKNTYFWIAGILFILGVLALPFLAGPEAVRDPGQKREGGLIFIYLGGAVVMLVNGLLSHVQTIKAYQEQMESTTPTEPEKEETL